MDKPFGADELLQKMAEHVGVILEYDAEQSGSDAVEVSATDLQRLLPA